MSKLPALIVFGVSLVHCGPTMPVKATFVSCTDHTPVASAQVERVGGNISRTRADGTWDTTSIGSGSLPVHVIAKGFEQQQVDLKPGPQGNEICLTPQ